MSTTLILLSVIGGSIAILVLGVITLMVWESNSRRTPSAQGNIGLSVGFKKYLGKVPVTIAVGIMLVMVGIWFSSSTDSPQPTPDKPSNSQSSMESKIATPTTQKPLVSQDAFASFDANLLIAVGILVILAIIGAFKKGGSVGTSALIVVVGALVFVGVDDALKILKKVQGGVSSMVLSESDKKTPLVEPKGLPEGRVWTTIHVVWDETNPDGTIPMYTPSGPVEIKPGCTIAFSGRKGVDYNVLYNEIGGGWEVVKLGQHALGDKIKFMVTRKGVKDVTYEYSCP